MKKNELQHFMWLMCMGLRDAAKIVSPTRELPDLTSKPKPLNLYIMELRIYKHLNNSLS